MSFSISMGVRKQDAALATRSIALSRSDRRTSEASLRTTTCHPLWSRNPQPRSKCREISSFNGGGGMGPPLMDNIWIYGDSIENIGASIREGRPNGMPAFRGFLPDEQIWQLAAYAFALASGAERHGCTRREEVTLTHGRFQTSGCTRPST